MVVLVIFCKLLLVPAGSLTLRLQDVFIAPFIKKMFDLMLGFFSFSYVDLGM